MKATTKLIVAGVALVVVMLVAFEGLGRMEGRHEAELNQLFDNARTGHKATAAASLRRQHAFDSLSVIVRRERSRRLLETARADSSARLVRAADSALADARLAGDTIRIIISQDEVIRTLRDENGRLRGALDAAVSEIGTLDAQQGVLIADRDGWKANSDSLAAALERINAARVCRWFGLRFAPRCLSRTQSAAVGGGVVIIGDIVIRALLK